MQTRMSSSIEDITHDPAPPFVTRTLRIRVPLTFRTTRVSPSEAISSPRDGQPPEEVQDVAADGSEIIRRDGGACDFVEIVYCKGSRRP